uniref:Uncharacterized protein n=1 Tax=Acrobeloides nanus TaxID=290746 RepID=A0A914DZQ2_9BILA
MKFFYNTTFVEPHFSIAGDEDQLAKTRSQIPPTTLKSVAAVAVRPKRSFISTFDYYCIHFLKALFSYGIWLVKLNQFRLRWMRDSNTAHNTT